MGLQYRFICLILIALGPFTFASGAKKEQPKPTLPPCLSALVNSPLGDFKKWSLLKISTYGDLGKPGSMTTAELLLMKSGLEQELIELNQVIVAANPLISGADAVDAVVYLKLKVLELPGAMGDVQVQVAAQRVYKDGTFEHLEPAKANLPYLSRFSVRYLIALQMLANFNREAWHTIVLNSDWYPLGREFGAGSVTLKTIAPNLGRLEAADVTINGEVHAFDFEDLRSIYTSAVQSIKAEKEKPIVRQALHDRMVLQQQELAERINAMGEQDFRMSQYDGSLGNRRMADYERRVRGNSLAMGIDRDNKNAVQNEIRLLTSIP